MCGCATFTLLRVATTGGRLCTNRYPLTVTWGESPRMSIFFFKNFLILAALNFSSLDSVTKRAPPTGAPPSGLWNLTGDVPGQPSPWSATGSHALRACAAAAGLLGCWPCRRAGAMLDALVSLLAGLARFRCHLPGRMATARRAGSL